MGSPGLQTRIFMYSAFITILAIGFLIVWILERRKNASLKKEIVDLDKGNFELAESYEMDLLTATENTQAAMNSNSYLRDSLQNAENIIEHHAQHCHNLVDIEIGRLMDMFAKECEPTSEEVPTGG